MQWVTSFFTSSTKKIVIMRFITTLLCFLCLTNGILQAQHLSNPFKNVAVSNATYAARAGMPKVFEAYETNFSALQKALKQAPKTEGTQAFSLELPVISGQTAVFAVWQIDVMHPDLGARYPEIRTYAGEALDGSGRTLRITTSPKGLIATFMRADMGIEMLEPIDLNNPDVYMLFDQASVSHTLPASAQRMCGVEDDMMDQTEIVSAQPIAHQRHAAAPVNVRVYRCAVATTGHFAIDNGGTVPSVLAVVVDRVSRISALLERDANIRLQLVSNNDKIIFLDPDTDPYSGIDVGDWLGQNPAVLSGFIGNSNYDIGHVFGRYFSGTAIGVASLSGTCTGNKGAASSAGFIPYDDYFVSVAAHEMGHQLSATHTFNRCGDNAQRSGNSAWEPGSGSTVMSYDGACGSDNVNGGPQIYYHGGTIGQIKNFIATGNGSNCGTVQTVGNNEPDVLSLIPDSLYVPISTPFELKGEGADADGDALTFAWEQMDLGGDAPLGTENTNSPLFRSFPPDNSPNRTFPQLSNIINNQSSTREILPTQTRKMNFRLTGRDNKTGGGGVAQDNLLLFVTNTAGPFRVQNPNTSNVNWRQGAYELVEWDAANTDKAPVNCTSVDILLSTDNGQTYPIALATNVPNSGKAYVLVPNNVNTNSARVRVNGAVNVFFDISNIGFKVGPATTPAVTLGITTTKSRICLPDVFSTQVVSSGIGGFSNPVVLDIVSGLPAGAQYSFSPSTINPGETATLNLNLNGSTIEGVYNIQVRAIPVGADTALLPIELTLVSNDFSAVALASPANGSVGVVQTPVLKWKGVADANYYEVEVATNPAFNMGDLVASRYNVLVDTFQITNILTKGAIYYWRVRPVNECGYGPWTIPNAFVSIQEQCNTFSAFDLPKNISTGSNITVESKINIPTGTLVSDLNVKKIQGYHESFGNLEVTLTNPQGDNVLLFIGRCGTYNGLYNIGFDNAALGNFTCPTSNTGKAYRPAEPLEEFSGKDGGGQWTLRMRDLSAGFGGTFDAFQLELCSSASLSSPFIVTNNPLSVQSGTNEAITAGLLKTEDTNNGPDQLVYTLMSIPEFGRLEKSGVALFAGDQFLQTDLDNGVIRLFDYGNNLGGTDSFRFSVTDNEAGLVTGTFVIVPVPLSSSNPQLALQFGLSPNPSTGRVQVVLPENQRNTDVHISVWSASGQLVYQQTDLNNTWLSLGHLADGLYLVRVETPVGVGVRKLVLRRS
jgi:subtilisin-like proprotein convertase family protein